MQLTYLKLKDTVLLEYNLEENFFHILNNNLLPFSLRDKLIDTVSVDEEDAKALSKIYINNLSCLEEFFTNRSLSLSRENAKNILNYLELSQLNNFSQKAKIMALCHGLSVTDDFWITNEINDKWENFNVRENPLHESFQQIALFGKSLPSITGKFITPELTVQGAYAKAWFREKSGLTLYKAGTNNGNEPQREVLASRLLNYFNVPHVNYSLEKINNRIVSKCRSMVSDKYSIVTAAEVNTWCNHNNINFNEYVRNIDSEMFYKTIVVDYLIANRDRHDGNWGFYCNNETGKLECLHPLFDHNNAFDKEFMRDISGGNCQLIPGKTQKDAALYAIKHCDFRCTKSITKEIFNDREQYKTFMNRACELGLYKKVSFNILGLCDKYVPVELKKDNTNEYWEKLGMLNNNINSKTQHKEIER